LNNIQLPFRHEKRETGMAPRAKAATKTEEPATPAEPVRQRLRVIDNPGITEQFANQLLDVLLINGTVVAVTMGAKRNVRDAIHGERETVVAVNTRLTVDIQTAEALRNALNKVILMSKQAQGSVN
jgi:hypothetical protein